jgi:undecaprenyl-diphosphatase
MLYLIYIDQQITQLISSLLPRNQILHLIFSFFSLVGANIWIWILMIVLLFIFEENKNHRFLVYFLASFFLTSLLVNNILKTYFSRQRPFLKYNLPNNSCPYNSSFPSGHAALAFSSAYILANFDKKRKNYYYLFALLISLSRIYLYCHFFFDVLSGGIIGIMVSILILKLAPLTK